MSANALSGELGAVGERSSTAGSGSMSSASASERKARQAAAQSETHYADGVSPRVGTGLSPRHALLVIGYGNDLRGDDGAGIRAAEMVAAQAHDAQSLRVLITRQLTPDLADDIASAAQVVFVDAYAANGTGTALRVEPIGPDDRERASLLAHRLNPAGLLRLAAELYGAAPEAWVLGIPAYQFTIGETISSASAQMIDEAVALIGERAFPERKDQI